VNSLDKRQVLRTAVIGAPLAETGGGGKDECRRELKDLTNQERERVAGMEGGVGGAVR